MGPGDRSSLRGCRGTTALPPTASQPPDSESGCLGEAAHRGHFAATALGPSAGNSGCSSYLLTVTCPVFRNIQYPIDQLADLKTAVQGELTKAALAVTSLFSKSSLFAKSSV